MSEPYELFDDVGRQLPEKFIWPPLRIIKVLGAASPAQLELVGSQVMVWPEFLKYGWEIAHFRLTVRGKVCGWPDWLQFRVTGDYVFNQDCQVETVGPPRRLVNEGTREEARLKIMPVR